MEIGEAWNEILQEAGEWKEVEQFPIFRRRGRSPPRRNSGRVGFYRKNI